MQIRSHHTIWGSTETNGRGELLLDFILSTNLCIGCKPTFITRNRQEVIDIHLSQIQSGELEDVI